jgi:DNA-binding transcriptional MocR family regulator
MDYHPFLSAAARNFHESAIRRTGTLAARMPGLISFAAGAPAADMFPWPELQALTRELLETRDSTVLQYGPTRGYAPLIQSLVAMLADRGIAADPGDIIVTTGSQQGLDLAGRVLLDPGDAVIVELPTYTGAIAAFHNLQSTLAGVSQDAEGLSIAHLDETVAALARAGRRPRFVYVTPNFQNPTGALMSARRRQELLDAADRHDLLILEDDPYGSLYFDEASRAETRPMRADDRSGRVVYLGSISKTLVPGLRVAWMVAPAPIAARVELAKQAVDLCSGVFDQRIVHAAIERGIVRELAPALRQHYRDKRDVMETTLREVLGDRIRWTQPRGGFFLWADFGDGVDDTRLFEDAIAERVSFVVGSAFFVDGGGHRFGRLSYSAPTHDGLREGVARLARALDRTLTADSAVVAPISSRP